MGRQEAGSAGLGHQVGVEAEHDIGLGARAFEAQAGENGPAVVEADEVENAVALGLEGLLDRGPRAPVGNERAVCVDRQRRLFCRRGGEGEAGDKRAGDNCASDDRKCVFHLFLQPLAAEVRRFLRRAQIPPPV